MMKGPIVHELCVERNRETKKHKDDELHRGGGGGGGGGSDCNVVVFAFSCLLP